MPSLIVRPRARIFHGHDWVYGPEVMRVTGEPAPGEVVQLRDQKNRPLGSAIYNPASRIVARRISRRKQDLDGEFFRRRLERALAWRRTRGLDAPPCRLVWGEADGLPGVVVDHYGAAVVFQTNTLAMDLRRDLLVQAINEVIAPPCIVERNDQSGARQAEGLEERIGVVHGDDPGEITIETGGVRFGVHPAGGQKTGFYLDQLDNHRAVARFAEGRRVLDTFCNQGGFALHCAHAGAASVEAVDIASEAVERTHANAVANDLAVDAVEANVFDHLRALDDDGQGPRFDLIILDPPSFTRSRKTVPGALRGYKEIHLRALRLLAPGGLLATYSCSHHVGREEFLGMCVDAAVDAKRTLRLVETHTQRADHPVLPTLPETEYLKGFIFETVAAW